MDSTTAGRLRPRNSAPNRCSICNRPLLDMDAVFCGPGCASVPTPEEIAERCAEIRSRWTPQQFYHRMYGFDGGPEPYVIPGGVGDGGIGPMLGRSVELEA